MATPLSSADMAVRDATAAMAAAVETLRRFYRDTVKMVGVDDVADRVLVLSVVSGDSLWRNYSAADVELIQRRHGLDAVAWVDAAAAVDLEQLHEADTADALAERRAVVAPVTEATANEFARLAWGSDAGTVRTALDRLYVERINTTLAELQRRAGGLEMDSRDGAPVADQLAAAERLVADAEFVRAQLSNRATIEQLDAALIAGEPS